MIFAHDICESSVHATPVWTAKNEPC
jgi:hypothetical protein